MENTGNTTDDERTMYIRFQSGDDPDPHFEDVYHNPEDLHRVVRPKNLELLRTIAKHEPESIRETARLVDRDVRQVHTNLAELEDLHLIEFEEAGRSKKPAVWYDSIEVDLPLHDPDSEAVRA